MGIDYGSKYIGLALVQHTAEVPNRVLYAACVVVEPIPLQKLVERRAAARRLRRTQRTHRRRLRRLAQSLRGVPGAEQIVRFCRRRGFAYDPEETAADARSLHVPRADFFAALEAEIERVIAPGERARVRDACRRHLNKARNPRREIRQARFSNRGPSKCQWQGCRRSVPKAKNAAAERLRQALGAWLNPVFDESADKQRLRNSLEHWIRELAALARAYQKSETLDAAGAKAGKKWLARRKNRVLKHLCDRVASEASDKTAKKFAEHWKKTYCKNINEILQGKAKSGKGKAKPRKGKVTGRVPYCRQHSVTYLDYFLAGRQIPNREEVKLGRDVVGRQQQIRFARLWRFVEARLLPLAGGRIDRVVVERVAFDLLAGKLKDRQELSEEDTLKMYWQGPQYGFASRKAMLETEFDGLCAYCAQRRPVDVEHLLPQSQFPFDLYLNILPACDPCNVRKGGRTLHEAGMTVQENAYQAYARYVDGLRPPHLFHTIKKGLLNLLHRNGQSFGVEKQLGMLAANLVDISRTQTGQRPLARYLAGKLAEKSGERPKVQHVAGRHTWLYRSVILPKYDKPADKEEANLVNHAVDAILLACELPSAAALENPQWHMAASTVRDWRERVAQQGPAVREGLPAVEAPAPVPYFEEDLGLGYRRIDLSAFNWNRKRQSCYGVEPAGMSRQVAVSRQRLALRREPAAEVLKQLCSAAEKRDSQIKRIAHSGLRRLLEANREQAARKILDWLQASVRVGLATGTMGQHPADVARKRLLQDFAETPEELFFAADPKQRAHIPPTIGIRCVCKQSANKYDVSRVDRHGKPFQHYMSQPRRRAVYVGYRATGEGLDRTQPIVFSVSQTWALVRIIGKKGEQPLDLPPESALHGRALGSPENEKEFLARWQAAFDELCRGEGIVKRFRITQGAVIEKTDGTCFHFRNFDDQQPWMEGQPWKNIRRVFRSPFCLLAGAASLPAANDQQ